jgi:hypothetical protein
MIPTASANMADPIEAREKKIPKKRKGSDGLWG